MMRVRLLTALWLVFSSPAALALEAMSGGEMASVSGQAGIAFEWNLIVNANSDGTPDTSLPETERRLAVSIANRPEWLVLKGVTGRLYFPTFFLDATRSSTSPTPYADTSRFVSGTGSLVSPYDAPLLTVSFPEDIEIWNLAIGGMAIEYNNSPLASTPGYLQDPDDSDSFLSLGVNNSIAGQPATVSFEGKVTLFGF